MLIAREKIGAARIKDGDSIILSGDIGRHGMCIMSKRHGFEFEEELKSDCESLFFHVASLIDEGVDIHCLRDLTRGGLATALVELAESAKKEFGVNEESIKVCDMVRGSCELLGFDPMHVANEGRFVLFVNKEDEKKSLEVLRRFNDDAYIIGGVVRDGESVILSNEFGALRKLNRLIGDQLPRIC